MDGTSDNRLSSLRSDFHGGYVWLGGFRFFLAFLVFCAHATGAWDIFRGTVSSGALGVFLFFVVSGYIIVSALETAYAGRYWRFLSNRAIRLYPTFWATYFLSLAFLYFQGVVQLGGKDSVVNTTMEGLGPKSFLLGLTIVGGYFDSAALGPNNPAWSIITEIFFYATAAGAPFLLRFYMSQAQALWLAGAVALAGAAMVWVTHGSNRFYGALSFAPFFVAGAAHWYIRRGRGRPATWALFVAALAGCAVFILSADSYHLGTLSFADIRINQLAAFSALYVVFSLCIVAKFESPALMRIDQSIGNLTYPLYLCHVPLIAFLGHRYPGIQGIGYFAVLLAICVAASYAIHRLFELPFARLRDSLRGYAVAGK